MILADAAARQQLFDHFPKVDILVNNMGIFEPMDYMEITDEVWEHFFHVNVFVGKCFSKILFASYAPTKLRPCDFYCQRGSRYAFWRNAAVQHDKKR